MPYLGLAPTTGENNSFRILDDISSYTLTFDGSSSSVVSNSDETITENNHRFVQGQRVTYLNGGGANIGGLTTGSVYYIIRDDKNTIKLAETSTKAAALDAINLTVAASGSSHTLTVAFDGINTKFKATYGDGTIVNMTRAAQLIISINGVLQQPHDTSSPSSGFGYELPSVIVLSTAPQAAFEFWGNIIASNNPTYDIADNKVDTFVGNGSATEFTLSKNSVNNENLIVTLDGVIQYPTIGNTTRAYNTQDNVLTFTTAPGNGVDIQVRHIGFAGNVAGGGGGVTGFYGRTGNVSLFKTDLQNQDITLRNLTGVAATFTGNVSIAGTLTYQDVTNVDSVGIVTAKAGIHIDDSITHIGDSNTKIRFPDPDKISFETAGSERLGIGTTGGLKIGNVSSGKVIHYGTTSNYPNAAINILRYGQGYADIRLASNYGAKIAFAGASDNTDEFYIQQDNLKNTYIYNEAAKGITFGTSNTGRMWLDKDGNFKVVGVSTFNSDTHVGGNLLLGTTTETNNIRLGNRFAIAGTTAYTGMSITNYAGTTAAYKPLFDFNRSRGTSDGSFVAVEADDGLGEILFRGSGTSAFADAAAIRAYVDTGTGTAGNSDMPGKLTFSTSKHGGATVVERLRIDSVGNLDIPYADNATGLRQKIRFVTEANYFDEVAYISADRTAVSNAPTDLVFATGEVTAGVHERLRITSAGEVGIGTTNPAKTLDVYGSFQVKDSGGATRLLVHEDSGQFEVNQSVPTWTNTTHDPSPLLRWGWKSSCGNYMFTASGGNAAVGSQMSHIISENHGFKVGRSGYDGTDGDVSSTAEYFRITNTGLVGIGTDNPVNTLHLNGKTSGVGPILQMSNNTGDCRIFFGTHSTTADANAQGQIRYNVANNSLKVYTTGAERFRINSDGKVGISTGTISPDGNQLLIRAASTVGTIKGHIMLTGDGATVGEGPQIVFSESGSGSSYAGAYVGHIREGSNSTGALVFGTRATSGDANTVPIERLRINSLGAWAIEGENNYGTSGQVLTSNGNDSPTWQSGGGSTDLLEIMLFT